MENTQLSSNREITKPRKEYIGIAAKLLKFLGSGCTQVQAANACGVSEGLVSQLCAEESFQEQIAEVLSRNIEVASQIDENYVEVEKILSKRLRDVIGYMTNADQIARILKTVANIPRKTQPRVPLNLETVSGAIAPVALAIPIVARNVFVISPNSEVVKLDDKELVTLNSSSMESLLRQKRERVTIEQSKPVKFVEPVNGKPYQSSDEYSDL